MFENICRICSNRGNYDIFAVIPAYLHGSINDFVYWKKDIATMLEETTGLVVTSEDGLPQKMCALCISYLKHAATFRQQAIDNALGLKAALAFCKPLPTINNKTNKTTKNDDIANKDKESLLITANDLIYSEKRKTDTNALVNNQSAIANKSNEYVKKFLDLDKIETNATQEKSTNEALRQYVNLLFDKQVDTRKSPRRMRASELALQRMHINNEEEGLVAGYIRSPIDDNYQTASSGDDEKKSPKKDFFSYTEKNFEEDDIMDLDEVRDANITVNIPQEKLKERKCPACFRRFMFENTYQEHTTLCIEYKFLVLIEEINRLLDIRRQKAVSPHEFIRRIIFCLKKTCLWLQTHCGEILLPDLDNDNIKKPEDKSSTTEESIDCKNNVNDTAKLEMGTELKSLNNNKSWNLKNENLHAKINNNKINEKPSTTGMKLLEILKVKADASLIRYVTKTPDPLLLRLKNNGTFATSTPEPDDLRTVNSNNLPLLCSQLEQQLNLNKVCNKDNDNSLSQSLTNGQQTEGISNIITKTDNPRGFTRIHTSEDDEDTKSDKIKKQESKIAIKFPALAEQNANDQNILKTASETSKNNVDSTNIHSTKQKLIAPIFQRAQICPTEVPFGPVFPATGFSAKCPICNQLFESISSLEKHNAQFHNDRTKMKKKETEVTTFQQNDDDKFEGYVSIY